MSKAFVKFPVALALDPSLTSGARACYAVLAQRAYVQGRRNEDDVVPSAPRRDVAHVLGVSENTVRSYIEELTAAGWIREWRKTRRSARSIAVYERARIDNPQAVEAPVDNSDFEGSSRARDPRFEKNYIDATSKDVAQLGPPGLVRIDNRDLAFDVLQAEARIGERSPRVKEVPVALNGSRTTGPGIREQFWGEVVERAVSLGVSEEELLERATSNAEGFERTLVAAVEQRCAMYREAFRDATLTPFALQKWWSDLPKMVEAQRRGDDDLVARMKREADRLRQEGH